MHTIADIDSLLFRFYEVSFSRNLGIPFPTFWAYKYRNISDYLANTEGIDAIRTKKKLEFYHYCIAPAVKLHRLLQFLRDRGLIVRSLLDFGCGDGSTTCYLSNAVQALRVCGVDKDQAILPSMKTLLNAKCSWTTSLGEMTDNRESFDLVTVIHSLHHISDSDHQQLLKKLASFIRPEGMMYVLEDGRDGETSSLDLCKSFDEDFSALNNIETHTLYRRNDYWANEWTYERKLNPRIHSYRTLSDWRLRLQSTGLRLIWSESRGFDSKRLHGVPSISFICRPYK